MSFSEKIRKIRTDRNLTALAFGKLLGVSNNTISRWESGKSLPRETTCKKIANVLGMDMSELMDDTDVSYTSAKTNGKNKNKQELTALSINLKKLRLDRDLTALDFGELIDVSNNTISRWENGKNRPQEGTCRKMAEALNIPLDELTETLGLSFPRQRNYKNKKAVKKPH